MKIDTSAIEGYAEMSAEDKLKALENLDLPDTSELEKVIAKQKETITKTSAEAAENRRKLAAKMSEDEAAEEARNEEFESMKTRLAEAERTNTINSHKATFLGLGYSSDLAEKKAKALADNDFDTVAKVEKQYRDELEQHIRAEIAKNTPRPEGNKPEGQEVDEAVEFAKKLAQSKKTAEEQSKEIYKKYINS